MMNSSNIRFIFCQRNRWL